MVDEELLNEEMILPEEDHGLEKDVIQSSKSLSQKGILPTA